MTVTVTATETDRVLASMFTENTGSHFLDSGGAYGRNWERNAGRDVDSFLAASGVTADIDAPGDYAYCPKGDFDVTVDAFHWLRDRLDFDPLMQRRFDLYVALRGEPDDPWLVEMEAFADAAKARYDEGYLSGTVNTYNGDCNLSSTLQWSMFDWDGDTYVLLQVHGGCDVRGGYTAPKAFRVTDYESATMYEFDSYELWCDWEPDDAPTLDGMPAYPDERHALSYRGEYITWGGSFTTDPWEDVDSKTFTDDDGVKQIACPYCAARGELRPMQLGTCGY